MLIPASPLKLSLHSRQNRQRFCLSGFTLIELLVVIVIVGILLTYATLAIRGNSPEEAIQKETLRFERLVELALEESILRGEEYGIEIFADGYRFYRFEDTGWQALSGDAILRDRELPEDMELDLSLEKTSIIIDPNASLELNKDKQNSDELDSELDASTESENEDDVAKKPKPQLMLLSSGEIHPEFELRFYILGVETSYFVRGTFNGKLETEQSEF